MRRVAGVGRRHFLDGQRVPGSKPISRRKNHCSDKNRSENPFCFHAREYPVTFMKLHDRCASKAYCWGGKPETEANPDSKLLGGFRASHANLILFPFEKSSNLHHC